jgi:hypothetical protein
MTAKTPPKPCGECGDTHHAVPPIHPCPACDVGIRWASHHTCRPHLFLRGAEIPRPPRTDNEDR